MLPGVSTAQTVVPKHVDLTNKKDNTSININNKNTNQKEGKKAQLQDCCTLELSNDKPNEATYSKSTEYKPDLNEMERLKQATDDALAPLRNLVEKLLAEQGLSFRDATENILDGEMVEIDEETRAEANSLISEGGEFSVENTATRLFDFAVAVSGGDKSKIEELKGFIKQGFEDAEKIFGGTLPDISYKTYDLTMQKLDEWASSE